jgi:sec-independent protein translocase protein TatC
VRVKVAVIAGVIVSPPMWLYRVWAFVAPGLYAREKRWSYIFLGSAVPLFLIAGVANPGPDPLTMLILGGGVTTPVTGISGFPCCRRSGPGRRAPEA